MASSFGIYFTEGKREQARYALEVTKKVLPYFNEYFGQRYPLPKLDQISFANTAAGGMENWGCIIYSDTAFLYDPQSSSLDTKQRRLRHHRARTRPSMVRRSRDDGLVG